jgi:hypothetical protein
MKLQQTSKIIITRGAHEIDLPPLPAEEPIWIFNMTEVHDWCRIIQVDGVSVLFYFEFNRSQDKYQIHALIKAKNAMFDTLLEKETELSQTEFNLYATEPVARVLIKRVKSLGHEPCISPGGRRYVHRQSISMH